ncbi:MAG: 50S ribosomal protein L3 N(5)-glutamine methyltransferase [Hyphomicrobium sp.]|jgi:ribosomal protein L3 glutamine methyltransferase|nr:50S ribosomal protein L3 N(5)-glutamine methyltransferase [Hyphomicrobium sp.]
MIETHQKDPAYELASIRDWLRWGVTQFERAGVVYGHGTDNAMDEAAFLILSSLNLPVDDIAPWLDCRLTQPERTSLRDLIEARVATRKPAAYLTRTAWIQRFKFYVDERAIVPRSYIGELLLRDGLASLIGEPGAISNVLDLCTGSGCLAILAAYIFPNAAIAASDISEDALDVARINVATYELQDRITLIRSDLFDGIPQQRFDLILANPPYVTSASVKGFPPEYRAEPELAHFGGADGLDLVRRILADARGYLSEEGILVVEVGQARAALETAYPGLPFFWLDTEESEGEVFALNAQDLASI